MKNISITEYYNQLAVSYDQNRFDNSYGRYIDFQEQKIIVKYIKKDNTLDLACGTGRFLHFAEFGADISPKMAEIAQKKHPNKKIYCCEASQLPFKNETLHYVFSFHLMMHLDKKTLQKILNEVHRTLSKKGVFMFDFPSSKRRKIINYKKKGWHGNTSYTIDEIKNFTQSNWNIKSVEGYALFPIHKIPVMFRKYFAYLDSFLCQTFLKKQASYFVVILEKK